MYGKQKMNHASIRKGQVTQLLPHDFESIGVNLLAAFRQFVELESHLEKEFKSTGGWLKKKKLDQFAG